MFKKITKKKREAEASLMWLKGVKYAKGYDQSG